MSVKSAKKLEKGFTLIEIVIVLAIIAILAAISLPAVYSQIVRAKEEAVKKEMENLKIALIGDPKLSNNGIRSDFGYLGDMGTFPEDLDKIAMKNNTAAGWSQPSWSFSGFLRTGAGWKGPYIKAIFSSENPLFKMDEWGNEYVYSTDDYINSNGDLVDAKIQSWGPDEALNTNDDIRVEILKSETTGTVTGFVNSAGNKPAAELPVSIHHPKEGQLASQTASTDANGYYKFDNIPFGPRSVTIGSGSGISYLPDSATTAGGGIDVLFSVQNISPSPVSINSLKAEYPVIAFYEEVKVDNTIVFTRNNPRVSSGELIALSSPITTNGSGLTLAPTTVYVDKPAIQVPTLIVGKSDALNTSAFQLKSFSNKILGNSKAADMRGVPFVIILSDGSAIRFTTPF